MGTKMKRFLSMLLAMLMVVSTPVTVFAENGITDSSTYAEDSMDISAVAKNTVTDKTYENLLTALGEAKDGESIVLSKNVEAAIVTVPENVTLDLNGYTLTASYMASFGDVVDKSADNAGVLKTAPSRIIIQEDNDQISVRTAEGYKFFEVMKFNTRYVEEESKYAFQPFVETGAHEILKQGAENAGVTVNVRISWVSTDGKRSQDFVYNDEMTFDFFESYDAEKDSYGRMFTLVLNGAEQYKNLTFCAVVVSDTGIGNYSNSVVLNKDAEELSEDVTLNNAQAFALVSEGTKVDGETLTLTTEEMSETTADIQLADGEEMLSLNVHVNGVAKDNTVPVLVTIDEIAPEYLNQGNIKLYHVENDETVEMTRVYSLEEVDAHNEFYYDVLTGTITMALASFSEIAIVNDTENAWDGNVDTTWYNTTDTAFTICNADQLAGFGQIVGGMAAGIEKDTFAGKTVKLLADVNLGDEENANGSVIFYPIGYYNDRRSYEKVSGVSVTSNVSSFKGTFDGNGHTISNFYQNTWEMFGDYNDGYSGTPNHYSDAMGLFGYVNGGTVKNLTVSNFSSDGEFTPTGVIAAYAANATFENIAIRNCNPRVYNTGNGGIVGIGGNTNDPDTYQLTFNNITIDNSNKITALWGSWDVACGGLVGMFRGAGHVDMTNCHVAAQIDVYNDVCGNYQYYWYRYSGMMIGTNKNMITDADGYTVPETSKFHAENCTVHFGDWNNYYYCELVANSLASYTHDHQFSRLTEVDSVNVDNMTITVDGKTTAIPTSGRCNYVVVNGADSTENATCYHFVDGNVWNHASAGEETVDVNGDGVKETVLKENNQHIYLPFNQLFTGYGWGVKHIPVYNGENYAFEGIKILDREIANSVEKFESVGTTMYPNDTEIEIGKIFKAVDQYVNDIKGANVKVTVSKVGDLSTVEGVYTQNAGNWTKGTLRLSGVGAAQITITDYYFCKETTLDIVVYDAVKIDSKILADNASAESENPIVEGKDDGPASWAFDSENHWWHTNYTNENAEEGKTTLSDYEASSAATGEHEIWIQTGFEEKKEIGMLTYTGRPQETGRFAEYAVYIANIDNPTDPVTDADFGTEPIKTGVLENRADMQMIFLDQTVEATHIRIAARSIYRDGYYSQHVAAKEICVYEVGTVEKFAEADGFVGLYQNGKTVKLSELFKAIEEIRVPIDNKNVKVTVSKEGKINTVEGIYVPNEENWEEGTVTFNGMGAAKITITDEYFCEKLTLDIDVFEPVEIDSEILKRNARANSEQNPIKWNDGYSKHAFDRNENLWWHSRYNSDDAVKETWENHTTGTPSESAPIWIETGFDEVKTIAKISYQGRKPDDKGNVRNIGKDYKILVTKLDDPLAMPDNNTKWVEVASGRFNQTVARQDVILSEPVEATHVRIQFTSVYAAAGSSHVSANEIYVYEVGSVEQFAVVGSSRDNEEGTEVTFGRDYVELKNCEFEFSVRSQDIGDLSKPALKYELKHFFKDNTGDHVVVFFGNNNYAGKPCHLNGTANVHIVPVEGKEGYYTMKSSENYLRFWSGEKDTPRYYYDAFATDPAENEEAHFEFFERDPGNTTSGIYGYKKVILDWTEIAENPKNYLIAKKAADGHYYVMNPRKYDESVSYQYVAKVPTVEEILKQNPNLGQ